MAENKKVQIKNTGGDALYPRTAAENIVNVPGGTMNVFMYLNGYGAENQFPDPYKGDRYFDSAAHKVYECVTDTTWTGKKEITSWDSNTLFFWNGNVWKYTDSEEGPLSPILCASVDPSVTNGVSLNGGNGSPLKAIASSATANAFGTVKTDATVTNGASLVNTNGSIKATVSSATASQLGTVKVTTTASNGVALAIANGAVSATQTFATNAEASAGTITTKGVTPAAMKNAMMWTAIQDKGTSNTVTLAPGGVFKVAPSGTLTLSAGTITSTGAYGADARLEVYLGSRPVSAVAPLILADPLTSNAGNNCVVKYRGGNAYLYKESADAGYPVTVSSGASTVSGTLAYGIANSNAWIVIPEGMSEPGHVVEGGTMTLKKTTNIIGAGSDTRISGTFDTTSGTLNLTNVNLYNVVQKGANNVNLGGTCYLEGGTNLVTSARGSTGGMEGGVAVAIANGARIIGLKGEGRSKPWINLNSHWMSVGSETTLDNVEIYGGFSYDDNPMFSGAVNLTSVSVSACSGIQSAGIMRLEEGQVANLTDCVFASYHDECRGELFDVQCEAGINMSRCAVINNAGGQVSSHGVMYLMGSGHFDSCTFSGNAITASAGNKVYGGVAWIGSSLNEFANCDFTSNTGSHGGVVCTGQEDQTHLLGGSGGSARFVDCRFTHNVAASGGVLYAAGNPGSPEPSLQFSRCVFSGNTATLGDVACLNNASVEFEDCRINGAIVAVPGPGVNGVVTEFKGTQIIFAGSNSFEGVISQGAGASATIYVSSGAVLDFTNVTTSTVMSANNIIVGHGKPGDYDLNPWTMGGSATIITSNARKTISGSGTKLTSSGTLTT
jgi:hypothetical protein